MKKKSLIKKSTVKKVESLPLINAAIAMTAIDGNVTCEMCGSKLSLITSITTLILAFSKRSKMPLNDVLDMVTYQVKQEIAEQDAESPFGKEFESSNGGEENERQQTILN